MRIRVNDPRLPERIYRDRIRTLYGGYHRCGDIPNAIELSNEISSWAYESLVEERGDELRFAQRSIVSAFMPKSGGTFLYNRLLHDCGYAPFLWYIQHPADQASVYAVPAALERYLRGGCAAHTHARPSPHNCRVLSDAGVDRIWVHVRDPLDATVAAFHHYRGEGQGEGAIAEHRRRENREEAERFGLLLDGDAEKVCAGFVRQNLPFMIAWLREWLWVEQLNPGFVHFTHFDELADPKALLDDVFRALRVEIAAPEITAHLPEDRRRLRSADESRFDLSEALRKEFGRQVAAQLGPAGWCERLAAMRDRLASRAASTRSE